MRSFCIALLASCLLACCSAEKGQSGLPTARLVIDTQKGPVAFNVEIAADQKSQETGLMYRTNLAPDAGMLFDFHTSQPETFWMKNTALSLDMIFIKADGTISTIAANTIPYSEDLVPSSEPVRAVLEINGGRSYALGITPGEKVHAAIFGNGP
jgi:uncharacterized protein